MRGIAAVSLGIASTFLAVVALLIGSTTLFYITTAIIALIAACRVQAWLSAGGLEVTRVAPAAVYVGEVVEVEIEVRSLHRVRRPVIEVRDVLPPRLIVADRTPGLPIAPSFEEPVRTYYRFRPLRRGRYRWSGLVVEGHDALGISLVCRTYETVASELLVLPRPIPVSVAMPLGGGFDFNDVRAGRQRGVGMDPYGVREYRTGDSLRHIHWKSTARAGKLLVKEFESGARGSVVFVMQSTNGSEFGEPPMTSLDAMCGHVAYLAESLSRKGLAVGIGKVSDLPTEESRNLEMMKTLARLRSDSQQSIGEAMIRALDLLEEGALVVCLARADESVVSGACEAAAQGVMCIFLVYDSTAFDATVDARTSAASPSFVSRLGATGSIVQMMPNPSHGASTLGMLK